MNRPSRTVLLGIAVLTACTAFAAPNTMEARFLNPTAEERALLGPLFWLHGDESPDLLERYVGIMAEGGNGCFTAESRPHVDWLGAGWWRDLSICLDAAKTNELEMWIFDEKWWPSGEVGGQVPREFASKYMQAAVSEVGGAMTFEVEYPEDRFIAALAGRSAGGKVDGGSLIDLADFARDGTLAWDVPDGTWQVMVFIWEYADDRGGRGYLVDGASKAAAEWYVNTVYQPHYDRYGDDFGKTIRGFFYDEPETLGDWGTEVLPLLKARGVDWKKALAAWKFELADPAQQAAAKYQYQDAFAEAWGRTLFGAVTEWCHQHDVRSIGHFLEHRMDYLDPHRCAGNMFQLQKYSDWGGIDAVFDQFIMGKRVARDAPTWQTPKLGSSITHAYGKPDDLAMVEIYGARGQDLTYPEMKWWLDHMQVSGINFIIPHAFNPRSPHDTDCPPYFYNNGYEPRWPLYRVFADYSVRLSHMLTGGRHVCPVALLYLGNSAHVGGHLTPEHMSAALQDALYDCDWIPYDVFEQDMDVSGRALELRDERYRILIAPPAEVAPLATMEKVRTFFDEGGVVVAHGMLPALPTELDRTPGEMRETVEAVWGAAPEPGWKACNASPNGGRAYLLPESPEYRRLGRVLAEDAGIRPTLEVLEGQTDGWLHVLHRVKNGRDVFFVCNQNDDGQARRFKMRARAQGYPELWDAMRGEICGVPFRRDGEWAIFELALESNEAVLLVFNGRKRALPARVDAAALAAGKEIPLAPRPVPAAMIRSGAPPTGKAPANPFEGLAWMWNPEHTVAGVDAPPGACGFRRQVNLPADASIGSAVFNITGDNQFTLYVNGARVVDGHNWQACYRVDVAEHLRGGANQFAVRGYNGGSSNNPAGVIGRLTISLADGGTVECAIDTTWKAAIEPKGDWTALGYDDTGWTAAAPVMEFPGEPWGRVPRGRLTPSPIEKSNPFAAKFELEEEDLADGNRLYLVAGAIAPEAAARVTVNGSYAGGFISRPLCLEIRKHAQPGENTLAVEPFTPEELRLVVVQ